MTTGTRSLGVLCLTLLALTTCSTRETGREAGFDATPLIGDLGALHHPITTSSPEAQQYFDQGLVLTFGFNHLAAIRSFRQASEVDPACAMCFWGTALALGPNINAPMGPEAGREARAALQRAMELASNASEPERGYIETLAQRYSPNPESEDRPALDREYANAMRELHQRYPDDLDLATLFAESLMNLSPWNHWTPEGEPIAETPEIVRTLEYVMERDPDHPGANHYYIHAVEASPHPEPPPWYFPQRQALGAVLLDAGRPAEAEKVYREDLAKNPRNGWSLFGLAQSLRQQGRSRDAAFVERGFVQAWARADVDLTASRF
jgi:tetratricopeptide (TPR) repeat protein